VIWWFMAYCSVGLLLWIWVAADEPDLRDPVLIVVSALFWPAALVVAARRLSKEGRNRLFIRTTDKRRLPQFLLPEGMVLAVIGVVELLTEVILYPFGLAPRSWTIRILLSIYSIQNIYPPGLIGRPDSKRPLGRFVLDVFLSLLAAVLVLVEGIVNTLLYPFRWQAHSWTLRYMVWAQNLLQGMRAQDEVR
jgi:hypothetical protein